MYNISVYQGCMIRGRLIVNFISHFESLVNQYEVACRKEALDIRLLSLNIVGYCRQQKSNYFDDECRHAAIEKNDAYQVTLKSAATCACTRSTVRRGEKNATSFIGRSMNL